MATLIKGRRVASASPSPPEGEVLRLEPHEDPGAHAARLGSLARVEVNFPKFGDGRGFSIARLLRERHGYAGELRAVGEVGLDHLHAMALCGFDSFLLRDGEDVEAALAAFEPFSEAYQGSVTQPLPLFRRRLERARGESESGNRARASRSRTP
jgi:uncharacterized protein (DUF934 family)